MWIRLPAGFALAKTDDDTPNAWAWLEGTDNIEGMSISVS
jgi:hypothetical protein